jgi:hypothetical protein
MEGGLFELSGLATGCPQSFRCCAPRGDRYLPLDKSIRPSLISMFLNRFGHEIDVIARSGPMRILSLNLAVS